MLRPLHAKPRARKFCTYDGEWVPADAKLAAKYGMVPMQLRLLGFYDGKRYQCFTTVQDFLNAVCTKRRSGQWFYAHAGGLYDLAYILEYLVDHPKEGISVDCAFSGSAAIIVKVTSGPYHWYFCDSFWLIRQPLRKIGDWLGVEKGGAEDSIEQFYAPFDELRDYNERDCIILYRAIETFEKSIRRLGGQLQKTIASTALDLFRRRFLHQDIGIDESVNLHARQAYCASRVEVYQRKCVNADYYDINSSFPYAMTTPCPGNIKSVGKRWKDGELALVRAEVSVPDSDVPPIPYRGDDRRVYFPVGKWESWFSNVDIELAQETGVRIEKISEVIRFDPFSDLKEYAQTIYEWRKGAESPALKVVLKFLLNSLYGKFGEGRMKQRVHINPPASFFEKHPEKDETGYGRHMLMPGVHALVEDKNIAHAHVPIAMHITAQARRTLTEYMREAERVYYVDTDGFAVPSPGGLPLGDELGELKLEKHIYEGEFAAPKLYAYRTKKNGKWVVKGKGFSHVHREDGKSSRINYEDFKRLLEHRELPLEQFVRIRTMFNEGKMAPRERIMMKTWRGGARPKRKPQGDASVPWDVAELVTEETETKKR